MRPQEEPLERDHCEWAETAIAYASGSKRPAKGSEFEQHLASCGICRRLISVYVTLVAPEVTVAEEQFISSIEPAVVGAVRALHRPPHRPPPQRWPVKLLRWWIPAAAVAATALALVFFRTGAVKDSTLSRGQAAYRLGVSQQRILQFCITEAPYAPYVPVRGDKEQRQLTAARVLLQAALAERPTPEAKHALGRVHLAEGNAPAALELLNEALIDRPGDLNLRCDRAVALAETGNLDQAQRELEAVLRADPIHPAALFNHALVSIRRGAKDVAAEDARRLSAEAPSSPWASELSALGKIP